MRALTSIYRTDQRTLRSLVSRELSGKVLDVGCGDASVRHWPPPGTVFVGLDQRPGPGVDIVGDAHRLPFADASFDGALCASVLEHVEDADQVVREMYRVLKLGGRLVTTIPFLHHYHRDPEDFRRLTHIGLERLLRKHGFSTVQVFRNCGVFAATEHLFFSVLVHARKERLVQQRWALFPYFILVGLCFLVFKLLSYLFAGIQQGDESVYVGVAAVATKSGPRAPLSAASRYAESTV